VYYNNCVVVIVVMVNDEKSGVNQFEQSKFFFEKHGKIKVKRVEQICMFRDVLVALL
jgi:hypothetical protein